MVTTLGYIMVEVLLGDPGSVFVLGHIWSCKFGLSLCVESHLNTRCQVSQPTSCRIHVFERYNLVLNLVKSKVNSGLA